MNTRTTVDLLKARPMARRVALKIASRSPALLSRDEAIALAESALVEAWQRYDPERGAAFLTYAYPWVRGALLRVVTRAREREAFERPLQGELCAHGLQEVALEARWLWRRLPSHARAIVFERVVLERSYAELGEGSSASTARRRVTRALAETRRSLML